MLCKGVHSRNVFDAQTAVMQDGPRTESVQLLLHAAGMSLHGLSLLAAVRGVTLCPDQVRVMRLSLLLLLLTLLCAHARKCITHAEMSRNVL